MSGELLLWRAAARAAAVTAAKARQQQASELACALRADIGAIEVSVCVSPCLW